MVIISSAIAFFGQGITVQTEPIPFPTDLSGCTSYVNHPATKAVLEALGANTVPAGKWGGPEVGEQYLALPLANNVRAEGMTKDVAIQSVAELQAVLCTRIA